ncbi:protein NIM1-INTERACTING 2 [Coffea eugenioides]|uniref:protein NIM1-INTERACTING 2 n=1 Tax=Coffea eugenioides TaxID=49369 RepID=UPI000F612667|nr:protein NIM1-INTERACTING 2 [Coffea eugenioides]
MEVEKRKRFDEEAVNGKKVKGSRKEADGGEKAAAAAVGLKMDEADGGDDDGEVEEFYAILRRIQVAVKYFEKSNGGSKKNSTAAVAWSPNFEREDFEVVNGVNSQERVEDNVGLDLNADPDPDNVSVTKNHRLVACSICHMSDPVSEVGASHVPTRTIGLG